MFKIFVSYRRKDTSFATDIICRALGERFGFDSVFYDVDTIPKGVDFRRHLSNSVDKCDVFLVVIGDRWLDARADDGTRRLDDPADFVRIEIETALRRGIPVIPVLVDEVSIPRVEDLPVSLQELAYRNAAEVHAGNYIHNHVDQLVRDMEKLLESKPSVQTTEPAKEGSSDSDERIANSIGMKLALISAGNFIMGSPDSDSQAGYTEKPEHTVKITKPFYLGIYPVTQEEYGKVIGSNPGNSKGDVRRPVGNVSWYDAVEYCNALSEQEDLQPYYKIDGEVSFIGGSGYRLPSEAEWEYACRAGTTTQWSCGDDESQLGDYAWYGSEMGSESNSVGEKKPNPWGLYDMHGNVWEWCQDWYFAYEQRLENDPSEWDLHPLGPEADGRKVIRGGSLVDTAWGVQSARRPVWGPTNHDKLVSFRVARTYR